jgi:protein SCO1
MRRPRRFPSSLVVVAALALVAANDGTLIAGTFDPPRAAPELGLAGSDGAPLVLGKFRGKVVALAFGFTSCPEVCPTTLAVLAQARKKLGVKASGLQVVYVTVDPERDDAARMKQYLAGFDPSFVGGTGSEAQLAAVRREFGVQATKREGADGATFSHSSFIYLIDRGGALRALMPYGHSPDDFAHDVGILLAE